MSHTRQQNETRRNEATSPTADQIVLLPLPVIMCGTPQSTVPQGVGGGATGNWDLNFMEGGNAGQTHSIDTGKPCGLKCASSAANQLENFLKYFKNKLLLKNVYLYNINSINF